SVLSVSVAKARVSVVPVIERFSVSIVMFNL
ncbi:MAG: hypothetical protein HW389_3484, partial [Bacteroidetes bacterium]|nr:hypothetical protein [Bacteroidota bacterium]